MRRAPVIEPGAEEFTELQRTARLTIIFLEM